jgi:tRNA nucleotidyltransferase (CCA-adding enzyme)
MQFLENLPFDLDLLPKPVYVVGGAVRDGLMGRVRAELDLDLVVPIGAVAVARQLAAEYRVGFVLLDAERQIARVVFPGMTVDIAQQEGESITRDLARRDYTLNAIAYDLQLKTIIDPHSGSQDIQQRMIRMVSRDNLIDDPLRLLRAYRQAAQLDFTIESVTRQTIRDLAHLATTVAAERVLAELRYLLKTARSSQCLVAVVTDDVLTGWLDAPVRENLAARLAEIDRAISTIQAEYPALDRELHQPLRDTIAISRAEMCKLTAILSPDLQVATAQMLRLTFSSAEIQVVTTAINYLPQLLQVKMSLTEQYFWFQVVGNNFPVLVILAIASRVKIDELRELIARYLDPIDQVAHPTPLISGHDLMQGLQLKPSPKIGKLLTEIQLARIKGEVITPDDAIEFARQVEACKSAVETAASDAKSAYAD